MTLQNVIAILTGSLALIGTVFGYVLYVAKLKWQNQLQDEKIKKNTDDINNVGSVISKFKTEHLDEYKGLSEKITEMEKSMVEMSTTLTHIRDVINKVEERLA